MRRWLLRICVFLVLGAIVNVAVTWCFASSVRFKVTQNLPDHFARSLRWFADERRWGIRVWFLADDSDEATDSSNINDLPRWIEWPATYPANYEDPNFMGWIEFHDAFGWPVLALTCSWRTHTNYLALVPNGLAIRDHLVGDPGERERALPLRPIWPGFAINTVFYAAVLWGLFVAPFALRRRMRIKRGLCPKCAYDLRNRPSDSSACPECGAAVGSVLRVLSNPMEPVS